MTNRNFLSSLLVLFRLKTRLLINSFINWKSVGRVFAAALTLIITTYSVSAGAVDLVFAMQVLPFGEFLLEWVLALISLYLILIVFTGDLLTGHSLNTGQMSSDFAYLVSLPIPPSSLIAIKLFERLLTDYIGLLIMFSGILGIVLRDGFSFSGLLAAVAIYLQISLLVGLAINILTIAMNRFFRTASINNFFSLLGYFSAFLTLFPYLLLSNFPAQSLSWLIEYSDSFTSPLFKALEPMRWLAVSLLKAGNCSEYAWWTVFWFILLIGGCAIFYLLIKLNWLTCSHSAAKRKSTGQRRIFRGFLQKELLLLRSDFNVLINAIFMPVTIIILEVYFFRQALGFTGSTQILNMIYAAIIYFCMFGPINAIGAEGKSIAIIESLPIAPGEFLMRKFTFWLIIAETIFLSASMIGFWYLNYAISMRVLFFIFFFTAACVWVSVAISAIFVNFSGKILQQRSTLTGKMVALALMLLAAPIKELDSLSSFNLLIFVLAAILIRQIAIFYLRFRLDQESSPNSPDKIMPYVLLILIFVGAEVAVKQFFRAVIPGQDTGLWAWVIAMLVFFLAIFAWTGNNLFSTRAKEIRKLVFRKPGASAAFAGLLAMPLGFFATIWFFSRKTGSLSILSDNVRSFLYGATDLSAPLLAQFSELPIWHQFIELGRSSYWFILIITLLTLLAFTIEAAFRSLLLESMPKRETLAIILSLCATSALFPAGLAFFGLCSGSIAIFLWLKFRSWPLNAMFMAILLQTIFVKLIFL